MMGKRLCDCGKWFTTKPNKDILSLGISFATELKCPSCKEAVKKQ